MRSIHSFLVRVLVVQITLILLPSTLGRSGLVASNLCASSTNDCVEEVNSFCTGGPGPMVDYALEVH